MNERMKVMVAYDGSAYADAALDDLRRAGLPREETICGFLAPQIAGAV